MFQWLKNLMAPRRSERAIFAYSDGTRTRHVDPIAAWSKIEDSLGTEWTQLIRILTAPLPAMPAGVDATGTLATHAKAQAEASTKIADAVCGAFGVEPLSTVDGKPVGLTQSERIQLAAEFVFFVSDLAEKARPFVNSSPPTG